MTTNFKTVTDRLILILLTIQISFVSLSIALSSIAFGIWFGIWLIQIIVIKKISYDEILFREMKILNLFVLLYFIAEVISRIFAVYPEGAFSNLKRLLLFSIFFISILKITDFESLIKIIFANIFIISLISFAELIQYSLKFSDLISKVPFSEIRIDYFNYPLTTAEIKMISFFSVFPLLFIKEKLLISKKYILMMIIPLFLSMLLTQSRNVFVGVFVSFLLFGIIANRKFLLSFIAVMLLAWIFLPAGMTNRVSSIADINHSSNSARLSMWKVGLQMFYDHPLTGTADSHIREIYETYKKPESDAEGVHLHNNYLMILATTGLPGFIAFAGLFLSIFLFQLKKYRTSTDNISKMLILGSILVSISFHISGFFEWSFGDHEVMTVFFFLISVPFVLSKAGVVSLLPDKSY